MGATLLIVDDEPMVIRSLCRMLKLHHPDVTCRAVGSAAAAREALADRTVTWSGFVVDVALGDGDGLDVLEEARAADHFVPAVIVSGHLSPELLNRAARLHAHYVTKPFSMAELSLFLRDALREDLALIGDRCAVQWRLSARERQLVVSALLDESAETFCARHHISENTYKTEVRSLLRKSKHAGLRQLALAALRGPWNGVPPSRARPR